MDGLNAQFMASPEDFLRRNPVGFKNNSPLENALSEPEPRVEYLDLSRAKSGDGVELELFSSRGKPASWFSNKIKAYWLPWNEGHTTEVQLGDDAPYFFTSELIGCRIQIAGDNASPTVLHIAGNIGTSSQSRDRQARERLGDAVEGSRRYSRGKEDGYSTIAFVCGYWDDASDRWRILAQETSYANRKTSVKKVRYL